jgi:hypothetical protein
MRKRVIRSRASQRTPFSCHGKTQTLTENEGAFRDPGTFGPQAVHARRIRQEAGACQCHVGSRRCIYIDVSKARTRLVPDGTGPSIHPSTHLISDPLPEYAPPIHPSILTPREAKVPSSRIMIPTGIPFTFGFPHLLVRAARVLYGMIR